MSDAKKFYCFCSSNCKYETMTKEQILAAIAQAVESGEIRDVDTGFVTKVKEKNVGDYVSFWVGTKAQYNALKSRETNCVYIITDDTATEELATAVNNLIAQYNQLDEQVRSGQKVDISGVVSLSWTTAGGGANLEDLHVRNRKYIYFPAMKIVFFEFDLEYCGSAVANEDVLFIHRGGFAPVKNSVPASADKQYLHCGYRYNSERSEHVFSVQFKEAFNNDALQTASICGWYFCNGEG